MTRWLLVAWLGAGCAAGPEPPAERPERPAPPPKAAATASAAPTRAPAPAPTTPVSAPACMPPALRAEGHLVAAELSGDRLSYCVRKGFGSDAPSVCLALALDSAKLEPEKDVWPGFRLGEPETLDNPAGAVAATAAGTLGVCARPGTCMEIRVRAPARDAFDEVFGVLPAVALPDAHRVIVAQGDGHELKRLRLDAFDVIKKRKLASRQHAVHGYPAELWPLGESALVALCDTENQTCNAAVVNKSLALTPLGVALDPKLTGGQGEPSQVLWKSGGEWALIEASGSQVLFLDPSGSVKRRVKLALSGDASLGVAHAGRRNAAELIVMPGAPSAGVVHLVDVATGGVKTLEPGACAAP